MSQPTMKAAVLKQFGAPLKVESVPAPSRGTGEVIVDVVAGRVLNYAKEVFSGERQYLLNVPVVPGPGGIGRVREVGPDSTRLKVGDWVYCNPTICSRDSGDNHDITLQGWSARGPEGLRLQEYFGNGSWAQQMRVPTENAVPLGTVDEADALAWLGLGSLLVPYGGLLAADLKAGETILVSGATGNFGSCAVAVALAMGAGCVIATGRNRAALDALRDRFGDRVRTVQMAGDEESDRAKIHEAAAHPIDCVFDILPPMATATQVRTALMSVRPYGRVILMGGVGMLGGAGLELPYPWIMRSCITIRGVWMYPPTAVPSLVRLVRSGQLDLDMFESTVFPLERVNEAVEHAWEHNGPFMQTVLSP
jgi:alcohol dehydrogenase